MQYDMKIEEVSSIARKLHFTVDSGEVKVELDRAYRDLMRKVRIPGFRPGKVPRKMVEARYAPQVKHEVFGKLIEAAYREAVRDLPVAGRPEVVEQSDVRGDADLTFSIEVDFRPEITVKGHKGVKVEMPVAKVTKADIDRAIGQQLAGQARIEEVTDDRPVQAGDLVVTQLTLTQSGTELVNEPGTMIHTVAERYYPGVEGLLIGMKVGDEKSEEVTIGQHTENQAIAGETVLAAVKVITIQAHVVPELDDEVAKALDFENAKDMKAKIKAQLQEFAENTGKNQARVNVLESLVESNSFDVPQGMVDEQLSALVDELRMRQAYMGRDPKNLKFSDAEMADLKTRAEFAARASCVLDGVARQESIEATDADLEAKIAEMAEQRGQPVEAIQGYIEQEGAAPMLRARIQEEKTLDWLIDNASIKTVEPAAAPDSADAAPADSSAADGAAWNKSMKKAELLEVAKGKGLSVTTKMTKAQIIEVLEGA
ncbi:MAG: trigger factor [Myxococcota bacterium]|nr:trigger factor [Myxococcota bacterium]